MKTQRDVQRRRRRRTGEEGFTLVEALTAVLILAFGLVGVTNLMLVAGSTNSVANQGTSATNHATEIMERLKGLSSSELVTGGSLTTDVGTANCDDDAVTTCANPGNFNAMRSIPGVGVIKTRWTIEAVGTGFFIRVRSEGMGALSRSRSRAEFSMARQPNN